jgi:hypothetical protein
MPHPALERKATDQWRQKRIRIIDLGQGGSHLAT